MGMYIGHFDFQHPLLWTVPDLLTADECARILADVSGHDWLPATVNSAAGRVVEAKIRDNTLAVVRDPARRGYSGASRARSSPASAPTPCARDGIDDSALGWPRRLEPLAVRYRPKNDAC